MLLMFAIQMIISKQPRKDNWSIQKDDDYDADDADDDDDDSKP